MHRGYVAYLKRRIDHLETLNNSSQAIGVHNATETVGGDTTDFVSPQQRLVDAAVNEVEYLSVAAMSGPKRPHQVVLNNSFFASLVTAASKMAQEDLSALSGRQDPAELTVGKFREITLQTGRDCRYFIKCCHHNIGLLFPCIFTEVSVESFGTMFVDRPDDDDASVPDDKPPEVACIAYATLCLGIASSPYRRALVAHAYDFAARALALLPKLTAEASDKEMVRCMALVALVSLQFCRESSSMYLLGLAMTRAISTGMHRGNADMTDETRGSPLFWTLYVLDRTLSVVTGRPFQIEDGDIDLEMPQGVVHAPHSQSGLHLQSFFMWTVQYAQMLSDWRCGPRAEITVCLSSLKYWYQSSEDIIDVMGMAEDLQSADKPRLRAILGMHKEQLNCRALLQLLGHSIQRSLEEETRELLRGRLNQEAPRYFSNVQLCIDKYDFAPTVLDVVDILGATIAYIYSCQVCTTIETQYQGPQLAMAFAISDMKIVMTAMGVLHKIADVLVLAEDFHEFLWILLSTVEKKTQTAPARPTQSVEDDPCNVLDRAMARVGITMPSYWAQLIGECT